MQRAGRSWGTLPAMDAPDPVPLRHAPDRPRRRLISVFVAAVLAVQVGVPASYYLGDLTEAEASTGPTGTSPGATDPSTEPSARGRTQRPTRRPTQRPTQRPTRRYDERFAWRMFSGERAELCAVQVLERVRTQAGPRPRPLRLSTVIHKAWENALARWRPDVIEAFFDLRCAVPEVARVALTRRCRMAGGQPKPSETVTRDCPLRALTDAAGPAPTRAP